MTQTSLKVTTSSIFESEPDRERKSNADDERLFTGLSWLSLAEAVR